MIDTSCIYHISYLATQKKIFKMDLICPILIKRVKTKFKPISNNLSPYAAFIRPYKFRQISKTKYLYKNKYLSFGKIAILEPATLLKMIFNSSNFPRFYNTL